MTLQKRPSMTLSRAYLNNGIFAMVLAGLIGLLGCARFSGSQPQEASVGPVRNLRIAVLPVNNLSGMPAPLKDLRQAIIRGLTERGAVLLAEEELEKFMARHRLRYTGGLNSDVSLALKKETGADAVFITSLELYKESSPPKIALTQRLVSTGTDQRILWIDGRGLSGDDSPGILGLGLIMDPRRLMEKAVHSLLDSLFGEEGGATFEKRFKPLVMFRSFVFSPTLKYRVAVIPFSNLSGRKTQARSSALSSSGPWRPSGILR